MATGKGKKLGILAIQEESREPEERSGGSCRNDDEERA